MEGGRGVFSFGNFCKLPVSLSASAYERQREVGNIFCMGLNIVDFAHWIFTLPLARDTANLEKHPLCVLLYYFFMRHLHRYGTPFPRRAAVPQWSKIRKIARPRKTQQKPKLRNTAKKTQNWAPFHIVLSKRCSRT